MILFTFVHILVFGATCNNYHLLFLASECKSPSQSTKSSKILNCITNSVDLDQSAYILFAM